MGNFIGKSGNFYVKNPFDDGRYSYAAYLSKDAFETPFQRGYISHVDNETAFSDHMQDVGGGFIFTVKISGKKDEKINVDLEGKMETGSDFKEHLVEIINTHGRENVSYSYERIQ